MSLRRQVPKSPGGPPLSDKRALYIELMSKGISNSAACRMVGVHRRTGTRWRYGRTILNRAGKPRVYAPIVDQPGPGSDRFLSEAERLLIADGILAGLTVRAPPSCTEARPRSAGRSAATVIMPADTCRMAPTGKPSPGVADASKPS